VIPLTPRQCLTVIITTAQARRVAQIQQKHEKLLAIGRKQSRLTGRVRVNPLSALQLSPVTSSFWLAGGGEFSHKKGSPLGDVLLTAVNKIIQNAGRIAICSATSGGQSEDSEPPGMIELCGKPLFRLLIHE
jgi:hypothetical protein